MRSFLIKYLVGSYMWKHVQAPRAMFVTIPLGVLWGTFMWFGLTTLCWIVLGVLLLTLFISIFYFDFIHNVTYKEMQDDEQKYWYGLAVKSGDLTKPVTDVDWEEWKEVEKRILNR